MVQRLRRTSRRRSGSLVIVTLCLLVVVCITAPSHARSSASNSSGCTLPARTLSFACDGACGDAYIPCLKTNNHSTSTQSFKSSRCDYECFYVNGSLSTSYSKFVFLVPFGKWKSLQERAGFIAQASAYANDTNVFPSESNDRLRQVAKLQLPNETTYMCVCVFDKPRVLGWSWIYLTHCMRVVWFSVYV